MSDPLEHPSRTVRVVGIHASILVLSVVLAFVAIANIHAPEPKVLNRPITEMDMWVGFGDGMQILLLIMNIRLTVVLYALGSTLLLFLLRRRKDALLWAHGSCVTVVLLYWASVGY
ncbi:hypothetical protein LZC95_48675 [Pendulispora brunnea]|uniref:Uncharacterized protein n=1 Tax=Pendulispora brunnea TaxID=2905690 RepID=A0ABZ2K888_9BACT